MFDMKLASTVAPVFESVYRICCKIVFTCWLAHFAHRVGVSCGFAGFRDLQAKRQSTGEHSHLGCGTCAIRGERGPMTSFIKLFIVMVIFAVIVTSAIISGANGMMMMDFVDID